MKSSKQKCALKLTGAHAKKFARHAQYRRKNSEHIYANAEEFKVCSNCLSIAFQRAPLCPICHSYRWYNDPEVVKLIALVTSRAALPFTAGVVPRFKHEQPQHKVYNRQ
jgi:hypothetical protein